MLKVTCIAYSTPLVITAVTIGITVGYFDERHTNNLLGQGNTLWEHSLLTKTKYVSTRQCTSCFIGKVYISSTYYSENACWLHDESLNFGFLVPVGLILLHNFIVLVRVSYEIVIKMNSVSLVLFFKRISYTICIVYKTACISCISCIPLWWWV